MSVNPSSKVKDLDFSPMLLAATRPQACGCSCACCVAGHLAPEGGTACGCSCACCAGGHGAPMGTSVSPMAVRMLGHHPVAIAAEALERRFEAITKVLLPQARALSASLALANEKGAVGPGELEILGTLQRWVLQLQIEQDDLRLVLSPPDLGPKAP